MQHSTDNTEPVSTEKQSGSSRYIYPGGTLRTTLLKLDEDIIIEILETRTGHLITKAQYLKIQMYIIHIIL